MRPTVIQVNLSAAPGGAEVYTHFFTLALQRRGWANQLVFHPHAKFWKLFDFGELPMHRMDDSLFAAQRVIQALPSGSIVVIHSPLSTSVLQHIAAHHIIVGMAHQALYSTACPGYYRQADTLLPVSHHVSETLKRAGLTNIYAEPLYGVAELHRNAATAEAIVRGHLCDWDKRKLRDRLLALIAPVQSAFRNNRPFAKKPGLTIGIVSRIAPLKQFATLFRLIAPLLARYPQVNLEIFGSSTGYAPLRDLRRALKPMQGQVRFWGHQADVSRVYRELDFLLTGLAEREALGLNVIEAQLCGVPVLAPNAPPFTETVIDGQSGYLFRDPRVDNGSDFERLLQKITQPGMRIDPRNTQDHLARFSMEAFAARADRALQYVVEHCQRLDSRDSKK